MSWREQTLDTLTKARARVMAELEELDDLIAQLDGPKVVATTPAPPPKPPAPPKPKRVVGKPQEHLRAILEALQVEDTWTTHEVGELVGLSDEQARKYLEHLKTHGRAEKTESFITRGGRTPVLWKKIPLKPGEKAKEIVWP